jgi:hypothetical protein
MSCEETLDQFPARREGLGDLRSGNASLHDLDWRTAMSFWRLPCACAVRWQGAVDMALFARRNCLFCAASSGWKRHAQPRYPQPSVSQSRPGSVPRLVSALHGAVCRALPGRCGHRGEGLAPLV